MAVQLPGRGIQSEINITPLVDVVLVLLIIFMVATPVMQMGLDVEIPPKLTVTPEQRDPSRQQVVVRAEGATFTVNGSEVGRASLIDAIRSALERLPAESERVVFVDADPQTPFALSVAAMDAAKQAGASRVGVLTQ